jgi:hypothetical protein
LYLKKLDFRTKPEKNKDHNIMIKGSIHQENIIIVNTYVFNVIASNFIKWALLELKGWVSSNTITVGYFNIPLLSKQNNQHRNIRVKRYFRLNGLKRYLPNIPSNSSKMHILFISTKKVLLSLGKMVVLTNSKNWNHVLCF